MQAAARVDEISQSLAERKVAPPICTSRSRVRQVIEKVQNATRGLSTFPEENLIWDLSRIRRELASPTMIAFRVVVEGKARQLCRAIRDDLYLIIEEGLVNAFRHSRATEVEVEIVYAVNRFQMHIRDNGCGIDLQASSTGRIHQRGLYRMRERADRMGAKFKILSRTCKGTEIELSVPGLIAFESRFAHGFPGWLSRLYLQ